MMKGLIFAAGLACIAAPALGQDTTTTCSQIGNTVQCNSETRPNPYDAIASQPDTGAAVRQAYDAAQQERQAVLTPSPTPIDDAAYSREIRKQVGEYLSKGDCETAKALALRAGEIALANEAKAYCAGQ